MAAIVPGGKRCAGRSTLEKSQVESREHQNGPDIYQQPFPEPASEEQEICTDHHGYHRCHVKRDCDLSAHFTTSSYRPLALDLDLLRPFSIRELARLHAGAHKAVADRLSCGRKAARRISSGWVSATCSISMPPSVEATTIMRAVARSASRERYNSRSISQPAST